MLRMRFAARIGILVGLATVPGLWASVAAAPANLVSNGTFDGSVASWAGADWNSADANGSAASGSARVINNNPYMDYPNARYGTQCIQNIVPGEQYRLTGDVLVPAGQSQGAAAAIGAQGYTGAGCTGGYVEGGPNAGADGTGAWESLASVSTFSPGVRSAMIQLQTSKRVPVNPSGPVSAMFDNITFGPPTAGPPPAAFELFVPGVAATR